MTRELQAKALHISRNIYSSLPWGYRIAQLLFKLSFSVTDAFGKLVYAQFALAGVTGMPPIKGQDPLSLPESLFKHPERLPNDYGKNFANRIYAEILRKTRSPEKTEEVLSDVMFRMTKKFDLEKGVPLGQAEAYVHRLTSFALGDIMRKKDRGISLDTPTEDEDFQIDLEDPQTFKDLEDLIPHSELQGILREIGRIHPRAVDWFQGQLEGLSNRELAAEWGVTEARVSQLVRAIEPGVKKVLEEHLQ